MDKIYVVYWSQSGNTQAMAEAVGKGSLKQISRGHPRNKGHNK